MENKFFPEIKDIKGAVEHERSKKWVESRKRKQWFEDMNNTWFNGKSEWQTKWLNDLDDLIYRDERT